MRYSHTSTYMDLTYRPATASSFSQLFLASISQQKRNCRFWWKIRSKLINLIELTTQKLVIFLILKRFSFHVHYQNNKNVELEPWRWVEFGMEKRNGMIKTNNNRYLDQFLSMFQLSISFDAKEKRVWKKSIKKLKYLKIDTWLIILSVSSAKLKTTPTRQSLISKWAE